MFSSPSQIAAEEKDISLNLRQALNICPRCNTVRVTRSNDGL